MHEMNVLTSIKAVRKGAKELALLSDEERVALLERAAATLLDRCDEILSANEIDLEESREKGIKDAILHRIALPKEKLESTVQAMRSVGKLPCPIGKVKERRLLDEGLLLEKVTYPLGVIGMIFEARPDAMIQIISLAIKSGNGIILKGGSEAKNTNQAIARILSDSLDGAKWMLLLSSHSDVDMMLKAEKDIDLIIPRGSNEFVRHVMENTHIPVMGHADGICSVYIDNEADLEKAVRVATDAKVQYPAACNAAETILVHRDIAAAFLPRFKESLDSYNVIIHADEETRKYIECLPASEEDYHTEYLALEVAIKVVKDIDEAIEHIANHSSHHTDAIVTENKDKIVRFFNEVDSADVFANASTRFADGFRFGLGAEVGISTSKLHARGPVGLDGLTTTKWQLRGSGNIVASYSGKNGKQFLHKELDV
ncbi:MAG: glutamate-5-semialdehyde dehydrogenase [Spirochaetales bacterium]|nr:glutamate-5-semialdehyde dehydrogenase [Spirochaetales bacterium]